LDEAHQRRTNAGTLKTWSHDHVHKSCIINTVADGTRNTDELSVVERESTRNATFKGDSKLIWRPWNPTDLLEQSGSLFPGN
jgi:hypothetical protein